MIATITIDRPEKKNAMTYAILGDFIEAVAAAGDGSGDVRRRRHRRPRCVLCRDRPLRSRRHAGRVAALRGTATEPPTVVAARRVPKPTICAVDGPAVGMGAEFTSQCDLRIASTNASFAWNFVHRGLVPDTGAGTWLLPRLIGVQAALRLMYTGERIGADEAHAPGLPHRGRRPRRTCSARPARWPRPSPPPRRSAAG